MFVAFDGRLKRTGRVWFDQRTASVLTEMCAGRWPITDQFWTDNKWKYFYKNAGTEYFNTTKKMNEWNEIL